MVIIARLNVGGPAVHVVDLARGLDSERFETLLVFGRPEAGEGDMGYLADEAGVPVHMIPHLRREIRPWSDIVALFKLLRLMRAWRPDIVHTHTFKAGALGRIAAWAARVPVVVHTFHGHTFRGYWGLFGSKLAVWLERALANITDVIVTVSEAIQRDLVELRIKAPEQVHVVSLGLDLRPFRDCSSRQGEFRNELGVSSDAPLVGIVGRLVPIKNHGLFVEAARHLVDDGFAGQFVVVGGGELETAHRAAVARLGLSDRVHFAGWQRDLPRVYADLDVVVNTSRNEGTPVAVIEAMAAGAPVVATAVGGVPDMIEHGVTGYLVPPDDTVALAHMIQTSLQSGRTVCAAAQRAALERYSLDDLLSCMAGLYESLLQEGKRQALIA